MKKDISIAISSIIEGILSGFFKNEVVYICMQANYLCYPHKIRDSNNNSDAISHTTFVHFIFYRPANNTFVFLHESDLSYYEEFCEFERISGQGSIVIDVVKSELNKIHQRIINEIKQQFKELKVEIPSTLITEQPYFCRLEKIETLARGYWGWKGRLFFKEG